jgi:hypothetical protein
MSVPEMGSGVVDESVASIALPLGTNGFHLEPRCRICRNDHVRTKVNDLLATGASYAMVLRALAQMWLKAGETTSARSMASGRIVRKPSADRPQQYQDSLRQPSQPTLLTCTFGQRPSVAAVRNVERNGLKIRPVWVRVPVGAPHQCR